MTLGSLILRKKTRGGVAHWICEFLRPLQHTKPLQKYTPKYTPNPLPKPKYRKNTKQLRKPPIFVHFLYFFSYFGFGRGFGVYFGVYFGLRRGFVFCRGRTNSQHWILCTELENKHVVKYPPRTIANIVVHGQGNEAR